MKKYLVLALLFASSFAYSQKNDTCDYFSVGVYGGCYMTDINHLQPANRYINSIVGELEYRKSKDFSFFLNVLYQFTNNDIKELYGILNKPSIIVTESPITLKTVVTIGARYYLSNKKVNPFLTLGLSQEFTDFGKYSYRENFIGGGYLTSGRNEISYYAFSILAGAGLNFNINREFIFDIQYNMYQNIGKQDGINMGYSLYGGLKYNLF